MLGGRQVRLGQHLAERAALLGQVDRLRAGAHDRHPGVLEGLGQPQRGLPAELDDHAGDRAGLAFGVHDLEHVLAGQRLEVEPVGGVVVGGDGLGVAVDHDRLVARVRQRHRRVHAGVVELDALADPVRTAAQDQHRRPGPRLHLGLVVVGAVVVRRPGGELGRAGVDRLVDRPDAEGPADAADHVLAQVPEAGDLGVGEAVPLGRPQHVRGQLGGRSRSWSPPRSAAPADRRTRDRSWSPRTPARGSRRPAAPASPPPAARRAAGTPPRAGRQLA